MLPNFVRYSVISRVNRASLIIKLGVLDRDRCDRAPPKSSLYESRGAALGKAKQREFLSFDDRQLGVEVGAADRRRPSGLDLTAAARRGIYAATTEVLCSPAPPARCWRAQRITGPSR
jgi:hypothetical protein